MMRFKEMWEVNNRIGKDTRDFYKDYWKETLVVSLVSGVLTFGGTILYHKVGEILATKRRNKIMEEFES